MKKYLLSLICCVAALSASALNIKIDDWVFPGESTVVFTSDAENIDDVKDELWMSGYNTGTSEMTQVKDELIHWHSVADSIQRAANDFEGQIATKDAIITDKVSQIYKANSDLSACKADNAELFDFLAIQGDTIAFRTKQVADLNAVIDSLKFVTNAYQEFFVKADSSYNSLEDKYDSVFTRYGRLEELFKANEMIISKQDSIVRAQDSIIDALKFEVKKAGYVQTYLMIADSVAIIVNGERINTAPDINSELYEVTMEDSQALEDANFGASNAAFTFLADSITAGATEVTIKVYQDGKGMIDSTVFPMNFIIDRPIKDGSWVFVDLIVGTLAIDKKDVPDQPIPPVTPADPVTPDVPEAPKNPLLAQGHKLLTSDMVDVLPSKPEVHLSIPEIPEDWYYDKDSNTFSYYAPDWFNERTEKTVGDTLYFHMSIFKDASSWDDYTNDVIIKSVGTGAGKYVIDLATMTCNFVPFSEVRYYVVRVFNDDMSAGTPVTDDYILETKWESQYSNVGYKIIDADAYTEIIEKAYQKFKYSNIQLQQVDDDWEAPVSGLIPVSTTASAIPTVHPSNNFCR